MSEIYIADMDARGSAAYVESEYLDAPLADERLATLLHEGDEQIHAAVEPDPALAALQGRELSMIAIRDLEAGRNALATYKTSLLSFDSSGTAAKTDGAVVGGVLGGAMGGGDGATVGGT